MCFCVSIWRKVYIRFRLFLHWMYWNEIQTLYAVRSRMMCLPRLRRIRFWTSWKWGGKMNNKCIYYVEGSCEQQLIAPLKEAPERLIPGKIKVFNVVQNLIPKSQMSENHFFHKFWIWRMSWFGVQTCELRWNWPKVEVLKISRRTFVKWKQKIVVPCLSVISWANCGWNSWWLAAWHWSAQLWCCCFLDFLVKLRYSETARKQNSTQSEKVDENQ